MSQRRPIPDVNALGRRFCVEHLTSCDSALVGACERHDQIQLRAGIDDPANAAKNSIYFSKCSETIDINRRKTCGLRKQFFVCHEGPRRLANDHDDRNATNVKLEFVARLQNLFLHHVFHIGTTGASA